LEENRFDISGLLLAEYTVKIKALANGDRQNNSEFSDIFTFSVLKQTLTVAPIADAFFMKAYDGTADLSIGYKKTFIKFTKPIDLYNLSCYNTT
jgi:hypothetical protein